MKLNRLGESQKSLGDFNPTWGETSSLKKEGIDLSGAEENRKEAEKETLELLSMMSKEEENEHISEHSGAGTSDDEDETYAKVLSYVEETKMEDGVEENNLALIMYEDEVQTKEIVSSVDPNIEEILALSLKHINIVNGLPTECLQWVCQDIQKFSKSMGSLGKVWKLKHFYFFLKLKRGAGKKEKGIVLSNGRRKSVESTPRELKRLESTVNYEGKREER